jgi:hypothetical protein
MKTWLREITDYERTALLTGLTFSFGYLSYHFYGIYSAPVWISGLILNAVNVINIDRNLSELSLELSIVAGTLLLALLFPIYRAYILVLLGVAVFYHASNLVESQSARIYRVAVLLNICVALIYFIAPERIEIYLLLAFVQGVPMIVDYFDR